MTMSGEAMVKLLKQNGYVVENIEGSHYQMRKGSKKVTVPVHKGKDLKTGTYHSILKQARLKLVLACD